MRSRLEVAFSNLLREKQPKVMVAFLQAVLVPFSYLYFFAIRLRNMLYDKGFMGRTRCAIPVVSVGNIVVGGTGKTPLVLLLAKTLSSFCRVAILSRGYRSKAEGAFPPLVLSRGAGPLHQAAICGDEAYLLASGVPEAIVIVGKHRKQAAKKAVEEGAQLILVDDGMQHRSLSRDIEIAVINNKNPLGGGYFLPRGFLRDDPKRLSKVDLIVVNGKEQSGWSIQNVPTVVTHYQPIAILDLNEKKIDIEKGTSVALFCGIGEPSRFVETVSQLGLHTVHTHFLADHEGISQKEMIRFVETAKKKGARWVLCTEKDRVKLDPVLQKHLPLPIGWVKCELMIQNNQEAWNKLIERIKILVKL